MSPIFSDIKTETVSEGLVKLILPPITDEEYPTVSIVTLTYKRPEFYDLMIRNWLKIDYPRSKLEWVIIDDGPEQNNNLFEKLEKLEERSKINYIKVDYHMKLGFKRNFATKLAKNEYIVHMDDDDFYPSCSVSARIRSLLNFQKELELSGIDKNMAIIGCQIVNCYDIIANKTFEAKDTKAETVSESTLAYSKKTWDSQKFNNDDIMTECIPFIKDRHICTIPSSFVVTQFTHTTNTVNRRLEGFVQTSYDFCGTLVMTDANLVNKIRSSIIVKEPIWSMAVEFVRKCNKSLNEYQLREHFKKIKNHHKLLMNPLVMSYRHEKLRIKKKSSGKDLVFYCGPGSNLNFTNKWSPESNIIGGSEEAVINLSIMFAKQGYNVSIYCVTDKERLYTPENSKSIRYFYHFMWNPLDTQDITILWRDPSLCNIEINSKKIFLDLHDAVDKEWIKEVSNKIIEKGITVMTKSIFHKNLVEIPEIKDNIKVIPNGISEKFECSEKFKNSLMNSNTLLSTSSPDRCLESLIKLSYKFPELEIRWAYGFNAGVNEGGIESDKRPEISAWVQKIKKDLEESSVKNLGRLSQNDIIKEYKKAGFFVYATAFPEIDCISLTKAMASGCIPLIACPDNSVFHEKINSMDFLKNLPLLSTVGATGTTTTVGTKNVSGNNSISTALNENLSEWFDNIENVIKVSNNLDEIRKKMSSVVYENYNWDNISKKWIELF